MPQKFTIRNQWVPKRLRVETASKSKLDAVIYHESPFMLAQEDGGIKEKGSHAMVVPVVGTARPSPTSTTTPGRWPGKLLAKPRFFSAKIHGRTALWQRGPQGAKTYGPVATRKRRKGFAKKIIKLRVWYRFIAQAKIKPRFDFGKTIELYANANMNDVIFDSLRKEFE